MKRVLAGLLACGLVGCWAPSASATTGFASSGTLAGDAGSAFGSAMSISADGTVAVVGEPAAGGGAGAALVFTNSGGTWTLAQTLTPTGETGAGHFGAAVAMDDGGQSLVVGAPDDNGGRGMAWVFAVSGGVWSQQGNIHPSGAEVGNGALGSSVAIGSGGQIVLAGAPLSSAGVGVVLQYDYDSTDGWYSFASVHESGESGAVHFGASIGMNNQSNAAMIGAPLAASGDGAVFAFTEFGLESPYFQQRNEISAPVSAGNFGASLVMSSDGTYGIVGAPLAGTAYGYYRSGMQCATFTGGAGFGSSVALARTSGSEVVVSDSTAAQAFSGSTCSWSADGSSLGSASVVALSGEAADLLAGDPAAGSGDGAVTAYRNGDITVPDAPSWTMLTPGDREVTVLWIAPAWDGRSAVTSYTATATPGGAACTSSGTQCTITGLAAGATYTIGVVAANAVGPGASASAGSVSFPADAPSPSPSPTPSVSPSPSAGPSVAPVPVVVVVAVRPVVTIGTSVVRAPAAVRVTCARAACAGTVAVDELVTVVHRSGRKTVRTTTAVRVGTASYTLAAGRSATVSPKVTPTGRKVLAASKKKAVTGRVTVVVRGGTTATRSVTLH